MSSCEILWKRSAERDLRNIDPQHIPRIIRAIEVLEDEPFPPQSRKLQGSEQEHQISVGEYRIIYQFSSTEKTITIFHVRHRKDAYR